MHAAIILPLSYLEKATLEGDKFRSRLQHVDDPEEPKKINFKTKVAEDSGRYFMVFVWRLP